MCKVSLTETLHQHWLGQFQCHVGSVRWGALDGAPTFFKVAHVKRMPVTIL